MSKYDACKLTYTSTELSASVTAEVTVLFEDGDVIEDVLSDAQGKMQSQVLTLKALSKIE